MCCITWLFWKMWWANNKLSPNNMICVVSSCRQPPLIPHEGSVNSMGAFVNHHCQAFRKRWRKVNCCSQPIDKTAASDHATTSASITKVDTTWPIFARFLVAVSQFAPDYSCRRHCPAINTVKISRTAKKTKVPPTLLLRYKKKTWTDKGRLRKSSKQ